MQTPADLDNLLLWLGPDINTGALKYVDVRRRLVALFTCRGCENADELADETLDRTARAILRPGFVFEGNPMAYLRGVARNICLESLRRKRTVSQDELPELAGEGPEPSQYSSGNEQVFHCLDRCLARLADDKRGLLLHYYQGEKSTKIDGRLNLARERGIELNALRIQVFRLRNAVRKCVKDCTDSREMASVI